MKNRETYVYLGLLAFAFLLGGLLIHQRAEVLRLREEIAGTNTDELRECNVQYIKRANDALTLRRQLQDCRATQRPGARCASEGGSPAIWADGFTQCWGADKTKPVLLWSSK